MLMTVKSNAIKSFMVIPPFLVSFLVFLAYMVVIRPICDIFASVVHAHISVCDFFVCMVSAGSAAFSSHSLHPNPTHYHIYGSNFLSIMHGYTQDNSHTFHLVF